MSCCCAVVSFCCCSGLVFYFQGRCAWAPRHETYIAGAFCSLHTCQQFQHPVLSAPPAGWPAVLPGQYVVRTSMLTLNMYCTQLLIRFGRSCMHFLTCCELAQVVCSCRNLLLPVPRLQVGVSQKQRSAHFEKPLGCTVHCGQGWHQEHRCRAGDWSWNW